MNKDNIFKRFKNKSGVNSYEIAKKTNIPEEKVVEILDGKREVPHELVDTFVEAVQKKPDEIEKIIKEQEINNWFIDNDFKKIIKDYGYSTNEVADIFKISCFIISNLKNKNVNKVSLKMKEKIYDFFTNELNKKVECYNKLEQQIKKEKSKMNSEMLEWYANNDIREMVDKEFGSAKECVVHFGYKPQSYSLVRSMAREKYDVSILFATRLYKYFNGNSEKMPKFIKRKTVETINSQKQDKVLEWIKSIDLKEFILNEFGSNMKCVVHFGYAPTSNNLISKMYKGIYNANLAEKLYDYAHNKNTKKEIEKDEIIIEEDVVIDDNFIEENNAIVDTFIEDNTNTLEESFEALDNELDTENSVFEEEVVIEQEEELEIEDERPYICENKVTLDIDYKQEYFNTLDILHETEKAVRRYEYLIDMLISKEK